MNTLLIIAQIVCYGVAIVTCLVGTMGQDTFDSTPAIPKPASAVDCKKSRTAHASGLPGRAFIMATASTDHLRCYIEYLFNPASQKGKRS